MSEETMVTTEEQLAADAQENQDVVETVLETEAAQEETHTEEEGSVEETSETVVTTGEAVVTTPSAEELAQNAIINLGDVEDEIQVQDHNYLFNYKRVPTPTGDLTNLFRLCYKETSQENWSIANGLLSKVFSIAKTEDVQQRIAEGLGATIAGQRHIRQDTSVKSTFTLVDYSLDIPEEDHIRNLMFKLLTNVDASEERLNEESALSFSIINGFSGNYALQLNYGFLKKITRGEGEDQQMVAVDNVFILYPYSTRLIHGSNLDISFEQVSNVRDNVRNQVNRFKGTNLNTEALEDLGKKMPKKFMKRFMGAWEDWPEEFKNLYYASFMWSAILDRDRRIHDEIKLRGWVESYFARLDRLARQAAASEEQSA